MRTTLVLAGALALGLASFSTARAQPDTGSAESLFRDGKALMSQGKLAEACEAFDGSYRKDPATSTLLNLADCREKNGQFASAWAAFVEAERRSRNADDPAQQAINNLARERTAKLEPRISFLTISVPDESRVDGLTITRDGDPVDPAEWNRRLPEDIGTHVIIAKAPAYEAWRTEITIKAEQEQQSVTVPKFKPLPAKVVGKKLDVVDTSPFTAQRKVAIGLAGGGVVAIGVGIGLYVTARSQYDDAKNEADDVKQKSLWDAANRKYLIGQIVGGVGVAMIGTAAYLWITGKPTVLERDVVAVSPTLDRDGGGLVVSGRW